MDWVKSTTDYYRDLAIATGSDAMEVMFTRGNALAGEIEQHGFIPDAMLAHLCRKPAQAKKTADQLVKAGLWERVRGGYLIVNFARINAELEKIVEKKKRDRDRKRAERARPTEADVSAGLSEDTSTDSHEDRLYESESKSQSKNAAAAASAPANLPDDLAILRSKLNTHKLIVRWDRLTPEAQAEISELIATHGDAALVKTALNAFQPNNPPVFAQAWLNAWRAIPAPGSLRVVETPCPEPGHQGTTTRCGDCIIAAKIGDNA